MILFSCHLRNSIFSLQITLPELEELTLHNLNIKGLWPRQFQSTSYSLQNLKTLHVEDCNNLSHLLPFAIVRSLVQLKELRVRACRNMEVLVMMEEQGEEQRLEDISFCKLETLELSNLPILGRFCAAACFSCPSLLKLTIIYCEQLRLINFRASTFARDDREIKKGEYFEREVIVFFSSFSIYIYIYLFIYLFIYCSLNLQLVIRLICIFCFSLCKP